MREFQSPTLIRGATSEVVNAKPACISCAHVAEILEANGSIKTFQRFGQTYYRWVKDRP